MNIVLNPIRSLLLGAAAILLTLASTTHSTAADPDIVGVLADAVDPAVSKSLELSDEQLETIRGLIESQESKVLDLYDKLRDVPKATAQERLQQSISELEAEAFKVLTIEQRSKLEQVRLNRVGLRSLAEPSVAETLGLSEGQQEQIQSILGSRIQLLREFGPERVDVELQNRLRKVLTSVQFATWQTMAGGGKVPARSATAEVASPATEIEAPTQAAVADTPEVQNYAPEVETTARNADAQKPSQTQSSSAARATTDQDEPKLVINFNGADWGTVLKWMASEADLNLQLNTVPTGTFTYRDPNKYSIAKAMDIMNGVLLGNGYTLVRRQRTLMVVDLGAGESADVARGLIRELAQLVTPDQLDDRGDYELLKCLFQLSRLTPEETEKQVKLLIGPHGSVIPLASANQILVVETGEKLRLIRDLIERAENPDPSKLGKVQAFVLKHVTAEEVLSIARGHLGIGEDSNTTDAITVSTDTFGNTIYASGRADKIQMLGEIVAKVDIEPSEGGPTSIQVQQPEIETHPVGNFDLDKAYDVLQTLLAGTPNVRLSTETVSKSIVAHAPPAEQRLIRETLAKLNGSAVQFVTIALKRLDPKSVIALLEKMLGKPAEGDAKGGSSAPVISGDTASRSLFVKGTEQQVQLVRSMVNQIEASGPDTSMLGDRVKFIPNNGKSTQRTIDNIKMLLEAQKRPIKINVHSAHSSEIDARTNSRRMQLGSDPLPKEVPESSKSKDDATELPAERTEASTPVESRESDKSKPEDLSSVKVPRGRLIQAVAREENQDKADETNEFETGKSETDESAEIPELEIFEGPGGLIVTGDPKALAEFEQLSTFLNDQIASGPVKPTIFYLKYVPVTPAADFIRQVMSGKVATGASGGGGLIGDAVSSALGGGLLGSMLGGGGGSGSTVSGPALASGEFSIVPNPRLNMMIVYANPVDLELIDMIVEKVDQEDSPLLVQIAGRPQVIPLKYAEASEVATIVKEAFASRIAQPQNGAGGGNRQQQPSPQEFLAALRGGRGGGGGAGGNQSNPMPEPQMTISVDSRNNAIVVTGPNSLFQEVKQFVELIDQGSIDTQEDVQVVQLGGRLNATVLQGALQSVLGPQANASVVGQNTQGQTRTGQNNQAFNPQQRGFGQGGFGQGGFNQGGNRGGFGTGNRNTNAGGNNAGRGRNQGRTGGGGGGRNQGR
jgi:type II secretory pathway component GspD/PulD (secretin)